MHEKQRTLPLQPAAKPATGHGAFRHKAQGATLKAVAGAYGLSQTSLSRVRQMVASQLSTNAR